MLGGMGSIWTSLMICMRVESRASRLHEICQEYASKRIVILIHVSLPQEMIRTTDRPQGRPWTADVCGLIPVLALSVPEHCGSGLRLGQRGPCSRIRASHRPMTDSGALIRDRDTGIRSRAPLSACRAPEEIRHLSTPLRRLRMRSRARLRRRSRTSFPQHRFEGSI